MPVVAKDDCRKLQRMADLKKRLDELEKRLKELEAKPLPVIGIPYPVPYVPYYPYPFYGLPPLTYPTCVPTIPWSGPVPYTAASTYTITTSAT